MPFSLRSVGHRRVEADPGRSAAPPRRGRITDFVQLFWCVSGQGYLTIHDEDVPLRRRAVAVLLPGMQHHYYALRKAWEYRWVTIDGPLATALIEGFGFQCRPFKVGACPERLFRRLYNCMQRVDPIGEKLATVKLYNLLVYIAVRIGNPIPAKGDKGEVLAEQARAAIRDTFDDSRVGIGQIAAGLGVNRSVLTRQFKRFTGLAPKEYMALLRLQKVFSLLKETDLPITDVSELAGFSNSNYMAKFFSKRMGQSPSEFRERFQYPSANTAPALRRA